MITQTYTTDMTRPLCPDCGAPVEMPANVTDPTQTWFGQCANGHAYDYQLDDEIWDIRDVATVLQNTCHWAAFQAGWWGGAHMPDPRSNPMCFSQKLMLVVSELAEAMEGDRKNLKDDHLPHRDMREVELADAVIRIMDMAGAFGMDIGGAIAEKMEYNRTRPDHKIENRMAAGGKEY